MKTLINKELIELTKGDGSREYHIKYKYEEIVGKIFKKSVYTEEEDLIIFDNVEDAQIFLNLTLGPSSDSYLLTKYDNDLYLCNAVTENDYETSLKYISNNNNVNRYIKYNKYGNVKFYLCTRGYNTKDISRNIWMFKYDPEKIRLSSYCYDTNNGDTSHYESVTDSDDVEKNIKKYIDNTKKGQRMRFGKQRKEKERKLLKETVVSCKVISGVNVTENPYERSAEVEAELKRLETKGMYNVRNNMIQDELKKIDDYRNLLLSLMHT